LSEPINASAAVLEIFEDHARIEQHCRPPEHIRILLPICSLPLTQAVERGLITWNHDAIFQDTLGVRSHQDRGAGEPEQSDHIPRCQPRRTDGGRRLGLEIIIINASTEGEIDAAFATAVAQRADAITIHDAYFESRRDQIAALALRHSLPAVGGQRTTVVAGGLMSYGANVADTYRQAGVYVGRILKGEKPADLPVIQPTKFELIINLKTAKALGLAIPDTFLLRADEVIE
jgi:hypothetical protein